MFVSCLCDVVSLPVAGVSSLAALEDLSVSLKFFLFLWVSVLTVGGARVGGAVEQSLIGVFVDGQVLSAMLKVFAEKDFAAKKPRGIAQTTDQITTELQMLRSAGWPSEIESSCLADNEPKHRRAILGWVWQVIAKDQLSRFGGKSGDDINEIYRWVDRYLADRYDDVDAGDALKGLGAFQDGKLLSYLVHRTDPSAIDLSGMYEDPVEEVTDRAIKRAADRLGVPALVDFEDIIGAPNDRSLVAYLTAFRETVEKDDNEIYDWVEKHLACAYPDIPAGYPQRGMESFKDGRLLDYLVHKGHPDSINLNSQQSKAPRDRVNTAVQAAKEALDFNPKLTGDDVAKGNEEKLKRYLHDLRNAIKNHEADEAKRREAQAAEEAERRRREAALRDAQEAEERARQEAAARRAVEDEKRRLEALRRAAKEEEERKRREAERRAAEEEAERRRREAARRAAEEEEERKRRDEAMNAIRSVRSIWPQKILCVELKELQVIPEFDSEPDANKSRMFGPGLERAQVNATATFVVETRNAKGQPIRVGGHPFRLVVEGPSPGQDPDIQSIVDNEDGTYTAKYIPKATGVHTVRVTLRGQNVAQSPVRVMADPAPEMASRGLMGEDDLDDLRKILEAIAREIARDRRNLDKLPKIVRRLEQLGLTNEQAKDLAYEVGQEDDPRLNDFLKQITAAKDKAMDMLDNPRMTKSEIRKAVTPMIKNIVGNMDDWADDYANVMDKIKNLKPSHRGGGQRQRVHLWIHRKGVAVPQHIMVTTNKPSAMNYRRHIRVDASKGYYDTHTDPAGYLDGLLGLTGELKLQKIDSHDRYLTGHKDKEESSELQLDEDADVEANIVNDKGQRVRPSEEPLLLEGGLQNDKGQAVYGFLFADALAMTQVVNNGERYVLRSLLKLDRSASVVPNHNGNPRSFLLRAKGGKERSFTAKSKDIASTWVSNISAAIKTKKGTF